MHSNITILFNMLNNIYKHYKLNIKKFSYQVVIICYRKHVIISKYKWNGFTYLLWNLKYYFRGIQVKIEENDAEMF